MTALKSRKRSFLIAIALALATANVVWIFSRTQAGTEDFELEFTSHVLDFTEGDLKNFPLFEHDAIGWSLHGQPLPSVHPYLIDSDPEQIGPDGIGEYLPFRLPEHATPQVTRSAFANLASQGLCQVAILDLTHQTGQSYEALVYRIRKVRTDEGHVVDCDQRV